VNTGIRYVFSVLFAALIAVSGLIVIPLPGGVPIVLKNLFVVLSGTVLGGFYGGLSVLIFLAAGILGLPVFVIPGGPGVFLTNLGGYLIGYFAGSLAAGLISGLPRQDEKKPGLMRLIRLALASFAGFALIDISGALYLALLNSMSFRTAFLAGVLPFIAGDAIKLALCVPLTLKLRPIAARYINPFFEDGLNA
jgi:biotin transport system substrate-specific component